MATGDGPRLRGDDEGTVADGAAVPGAPVDDVDGFPDDEVLDAELVDDGTGTAVGGSVDAEAAEADPYEVAVAERDEYLDSLRRLQAEFENYKKRVMKQQADQVARAAASLVDKLLPVLDALDLATDHVGDHDSEEAKALVAAAGLLRGILAKEGLERIDPVGEEFDPNAHEAVGHVPAPSDAEPTASGEPVVAQVMRAGYRWHGTVVRPAMVMVQG
ncbi:MAG: nucleotide exchange factor GrpE [Acidimicrobiales bacterium]|jgi:molecular chaperone GrpE (heat shock protein)